MCLQKILYWLKRDFLKNSEFDTPGCMFLRMEYLVESLGKMVLVRLKLFKFGCNSWMLLISVLGDFLYLIDESVLHCTPWNICALSFEETSLRGLVEMLQCENIVVAFSKSERILSMWLSLPVSKICGRFSTLFSVLWTEFFALLPKFPKPCFDSVLPASPYVKQVSKVSSWFAKEFNSLLSPLAYLNSSILLPALNRLISDSLFFKLSKSVNDLWRRPTCWVVFSSDSHNWSTYEKFFRFTAFLTFDKLVLSLISCQLDFVSRNSLNISWLIFFFCDWMPSNCFSIADNCGSLEDA